MKVHALQTGSVRVKTAQLAATGNTLSRAYGIFADPSWSEWLPTYSWAIEHSEGVIVVDSGQGAHLVDLPGKSLHPFLRWQADFRVEPEEEIGPQLRALGIGRRDVTQVVLTHMHIDHDAGLHHFPETPIYAARGEIQRSKGFAGTMRGYLPARWPDWFDPIALDLTDGPLGPFAASKRLTRAGDVSVIATPGHTPDHLAVVVEMDDATIMMAGDTAYGESLMLAGQSDGVSPNADVTRATLAAIQSFARDRPLIYLPSHDPESATRLAERRVVPTFSAASTSLN